MVTLWVGKGRWEKRFRVERFFTLHRKNRKAMKAAQKSPPCLWEQGQRTAKWLEGSGTHLKVSLRPDCGY